MPTHFDATVTTSAASLASFGPANAQNRGREVQIEADAGNTLSISWGDSALQNMSLSAGERQVIPISYLKEVFVKVAADTETLHIGWIN